MNKKNLYIMLLCSVVLAGCDYEPAGRDYPVCGNGFLEYAEACDDGNTLDEDGCSANCKTIERGYKCPVEGEPCEKMHLVVCGDGVVEGSEKCDDGNKVNGDGCSSNCRTIEDGFVCNYPGKPCSPKKHCGNGHIEQDDGEVCDDGNVEDGDGCSADCMTVEEGFRCLYPGFPCSPVGCGDGFEDPGEECDPGGFPVIYGGYCGADCKNTHYCGDGVREAVDIEYGEECDDGLNNVAASTEYHKCSNKCKILNYCGDGYVTVSDEPCDDGNLVNNDGCSDECKLEDGFACTIVNHLTTCLSVTCGNGVLEPNKNEFCDDFNRVSGDGCSAACRIERGWHCETNTEGLSVCTRTCGNGVLDPDDGEKCEDGNLENGDGCSDTCQVEAGYMCTLSDTPDASGHKLSICFARACGDGFRVGTEECDDGNTVNGDGCNKFCKRETGYHCPEKGGRCEKDVCGDGKVTGDETCDEGSANTTEGCINCQIQFGWECLTPGSPCTNTAVCGDGVLQGGEECDDTNTASDDGCSDRCKIETKYLCLGEPSVCSIGDCGDGVIQKGEACDDGNVSAGDGCSPVCTKENIFDCDSHGCRPTCGDGLTLWESGEECDDGNLVNGDGCSSNCKIETGFSCTKFTNEDPDAIDLPITIRDFIRYMNMSRDPNMSPMEDGFVSKEIYDSLPDSCKNGKSGYRTEPLLEVGRPSPDFYPFDVHSHCEHVVLPELGPDGIPVLGAPEDMVDDKGYNEKPCTELYTCPEVFKWWYTDVPGINQTVIKSLHLTKKPGVELATYEYDSGSAVQHGFLPLEEGDGYTMVPGSGPGEYTSEFKVYFRYRGKEVLDFRGDDDFWVFFNGRLGVDGGGIHGQWNKSITLDEKTAAEKYGMYPNGIYPMQMFHAERDLGPSYLPSWSNYRLTLIGFINMGTSQCASICGDGLTVGNEECDIKDHVDDEVARRAGCLNCKRMAYCGNGKVEIGEGCDNDQPWCKDCHVETCGDGKLDLHEECDVDNDGNILYNKHVWGESTDCAYCRIVGCGDGIADEGEECDDGNEIDDDACSTACTLPTCGDGIIQPWIGEVCDDGVNDGTYNHCGMGCTYQAPKCGDGILDMYNGEACDDGDNNGGYNTCNPDCTLPAHCGDGIVQEDYEDCDDGENNGIDASHCPTNCLITDN